MKRFSFEEPGNVPFIITLACLISIVILVVWNVQNNWRHIARIQGVIDQTKDVAKVNEELFALNRKLQSNFNVLAKQLVDCQNNK